MESASEPVDVAIVGGGAAGLAAAIFTARHNAGLRIVVLDGARKLGAKILISGGGRCNVTNDVVTADDFSGGSRHVIRRVLAAFSVDETVAFFRKIGVTLHVEPGGKLFPDTNRARTVLDALLGEAARLGVHIATGERVTAVRRCADGFDVVASSQTVRAGRVVLATGGRSVPKTGSDGGGYELARSLGHSLVPQTPALVPLVLEGDSHSPLSGISQEVELAVRVEGAKPTRLRGSLLWTHFGVSGPVVLNASRHWHAARLAGRSVGVSVNLVPGHDFEAADRRLLELTSSQPRLQLHNALATLLPARVAGAVTSHLKIGGTVTMAQLLRDDRRRLARALVDWPLEVRDSRGYAYAEVTAGGVPLAEIDPGTMQSRVCPRLYLVGEILEVDGRIGGFNFQWAWSSAWVAGLSLSGSPAIL